MSLEEVRPGSVLSCPSIDAPTADPADPISCPPSALTQTDEENSTPSGDKLTHHLSGIPDGIRKCWRYVWKERKLQGYRESFVSVVTFAALLMAGVTFWPTLTAASDGHKSELLAEWAARKDFLDNCEEHNWPSPSCDKARDIQIEAPPNFDGSIWKRYFTRASGTHHQLYDGNRGRAKDDCSYMFATLWYPVCAVLWIYISRLRRRGAMLPYGIRTLLRGLSNLSRHLHINYIYEDEEMALDQLLNRLKDQSDATSFGAEEESDEVIPEKHDSGLQQMPRQRHTLYSNDVTDPKDQLIREKDSVIKELRRTADILSEKLDVAKDRYDLGIKNRDEVIREQNNTIQRLKHLLNHYRGW